MRCRNSGVARATFDADMSQFPRLRRLTLATTLVGLLSLTACGVFEEHPNDPSGPNGGGVSEEDFQASAPDPSGKQYSHDEMREALGSSTRGRQVSDTDDWWADLRDINRELQRLRVDPPACKSFLTAGSLPVPSGALVAMAVSGERETVIASFDHDNSAADFFSMQQEGLSECATHTLTRELSEGDIEVSTESEELEVTTEASEGLAMQRVVSTEGEADAYSVVVVLQEGSAVATAAAHASEDYSDDEAEETVQLLEDEAARVLGELIGEDLRQPEDESDEDDADSDDSDSEDADDDDSADEDDSEEAADTQDSSDEE